MKPRDGKLSLNLGGDTDDGGGGGGLGLVL